MTELALGDGVTVYLGDNATVALLAKQGAETAKTNAEAAAADAAASASLAAAAGAGGYRYHPVFGTRYQGAAIRNGVMKDIIALEFYVDPFKVGASGDGSTHAQAVKTFAEARTWLLANTGARTIGYYVGTGAPIRDQLSLAEGNALNDNLQRSQISLVAYTLDGSNKAGLITGLDPAAAADWAAHPTYANVYQIAWDHEFPTEQLSVCNLRIFHMLSSKLQPLNRVETVAGRAEGTYWYETDNTLAQGVAKTLNAWFWGNADPTSEADGFAEITRRPCCFAGRENCFVQGLHGFAAGHNNGSLFMYSGGAYGCFLEEGTKHDWTALALDFRGVVAFNSFSETNYVGTATTPALAAVYRAAADNATCPLIDCFSICDPDYYDNTDGGYSWAHAYVVHGVSTPVGHVIWAGGGDNCVTASTQALANTATGYAVLRRGTDERGFAGVNMTVHGCLILDAKNGISGSGTVFSAEGNAIISSVGGNTADIETSVPNARIVRNMISHPGAYAEPRILLSAPGNPELGENVLDVGGGTGGAITLTAAPTGTMSLNRDYFIRPADPPGGDYPNLLKIGATSYANLADVQALGYEADGGVTGLNVIADAKFTSGQAPTPTALDVRFNADSPVLTMQTEQLSQTQINALKAGVTTKVNRAAAIAWVEAHEDWLPVRVVLA